jgi:hypothetical protein
MQEVLSLPAPVGQPVEEAPAEILKERLSRKLLPLSKPRGRRLGLPHLPSSLQERPKISLSQDTVDKLSFP